MSAARARGRAPSGGFGLPRVVAGLLALGALLALGGCSGGPPPATDAGAPSRASATTRAGRPGVWKPAEPDTLGPVVAIVGSKRITRHDVDSVIATAPLDIRDRLRSYDGYKQLVERMALEESMVQIAESEGIEEDPEYRAEVQRASRSAKMRVYYNRRVAALPETPDSAILAYYDEHRDDYRIPARVRVRHIQLDTQAEAKTVRRALVGGALWDETCRKRSKDAATKERGGLVGYVSQASELVPGIGKSPAIVAAAFDLEEGAISEPLKSDKGWHLIRTDNKEPATVQPFQEVRESIKQSLDSKITEEFSAAYSESLKTAADAKVFEDSIRIAVLPARTAPDLFKEAQAAINPRDRIELYRRVVQRFPNDSASVQARFMIGFTYAEDLEDREEAKKAFEEFLRLHPNHELSASARWMLENMDKPPPTMQEDDAPADSIAAPPDGGGEAGEQARRNP